MLFAKNHCRLGNKLSITWINSTQNIVVNNSSKHKKFQGWCLAITCFANNFGSNVNDARQALKLIPLSATFSACGLQKKYELRIELFRSENLTLIDPLKSHSFFCRFYNKVITFVVLGNYICCFRDVKTLAVIIACIIGTPKVVGFKGTHDN